MSEDQWEPIPDDVLRLIFIACHPVLSREGQAALTLRTVAGLTTDEIARMLLVPVATVQQRIVRAKKTLAAAGIPFDTPEANEWNGRLSAVLAVLYLIFTEGYAATSGDRWIRTEVANEALRLARVLARPAATGTRGVRTSGAHGASGVPVRRANQARRQPGPAPGPEPVALGQDTNRPWCGCACPCRCAGTWKGQLLPAGHDRVLPRNRRQLRRHGLAQDRGALRSTGTAEPQPCRGAQLRSRRFNGNRTSRCIDHC